MSIVHLGDPYIVFYSLLTSLFLCRKSLWKILALLEVGLFEGMFYMVTLGSSFPSGHAYHMVVFYGLFLFLVPRFLVPIFLVPILLLILTSLISIVSQGFHEPFEVVGSIILGIPTIYIIRKSSRALGMWKERIVERNR